MNVNINELLIDLSSTCRQANFENFYSGKISEEVWRNNNLKHDEEMSHLFDYIKELELKAEVLDILTNKEFDANQLIDSENVQDYNDFVHAVGNLVYLTDEQYDFLKRIFKKYE